MLCQGDEHGSPLICRIRCRERPGLPPYPPAQDFSLRHRPGSPALLAAATSLLALAGCLAALAPTYRAALTEPIESLGRE